MFLTCNASSATLSKRLASKLGNFKSAVATHAAGLEEDHENRNTRFESCVEQTGSSSDDFRRGHALEVFQEWERCCAAASVKIWTTDDFEACKVIGAGSFGVVYLAQIQGSPQYCALKQMKKAAYPRKNHRERILAERDILAEAQSRWIVDLYLTFQDSQNIYMVMEFLQGGDLITHLSMKTRFSVEETQFYVAELLEALDTVHRCGFVHRDVKPDNAVLTTRGHLKLLDFGLCRQDLSTIKQTLNHSGGPQFREKTKSIVGTPQYMAPEAFFADWGPEADIWSAGIITYELLVGTKPFCCGKAQGDEALDMIQQQIKDHRTIFSRKLSKYRDFGYIPLAAEDFLRKVVCARAARISIEQCRRETFFSGLEFPTLHLMTPPIIPEVVGPEDTRYFDKFNFQRLPPANRLAVQKDSGIQWANYEYDQRKRTLQSKDINEDHPHARTIRPVIAPTELLVSDCPAAQRNHTNTSGLAAAPHPSIASIRGAPLLPAHAPRHAPPSMIDICPPGDDES